MQAWCYQYRDGALNRGGIVLDHRFSDVHGKVTRESSLPLALESAQALLNLGTAGTSEKRFSGQESGSRILQPDTPHHDACTTSRRGSDQQQCLFSLLWPRRSRTLMSASAHNSAISFRRGGAMGHSRNARRLAARLSTPVFDPLSIPLHAVSFQVQG